MMRALLPFLVLNACTWVTQADKDALTPILDEDGDGYKNEVDCDPNDPAIHPRAKEIWYDGVNQNCDELNDYDQDGDGFISVGYEEQQRANVPEEQQLPEGDCCDLNRLISPKQGDAFYDGVDQNCDGKDDFDQDVDGYEGGTAISTQIIGEICPEAVVTQTGTDDCDDKNELINPVANDTCYDGIDSNCDNWDDDDCDHDSAAEVADCNDDDATISPLLSETWYNGIDNNCDGLNDYDQDQDGFVPTMYVGMQTQFPGGDCDDTNAAVYPHQSETLGDGVDSDCDLNDSTFRVVGLSELGWAFENPLALQYAQVGNNLYLGVNADHVRAEFSTGAHDDMYDGVAAIRWTASDATVDAVTVATEHWDISSTDTTRVALPAVTLMVEDGDLYGVGATNQVNNSKNYPRISMYRSSTGAPVSKQVTSARELPEDVAVAVDSNGVTNVFACNSNTSGLLMYLRVDGTQNDFDEPSGFPASVCAADFDGTNINYIAQEASGTSSASLVEYQVTWDPTGGQVALQPSGMTWEADAVDLDLPTGLSDRYLVVADRGNGIKIFNSGPTIKVAPTQTVTHVDFREDGNQVKMLGYVNAVGEAFFAYESGASYTIIPITLPEYMSATDISIWPVDGTGVYVAVTGLYTSGVSEVAIGLVKL